MGELRFLQLIKRGGRPGRSGLGSQQDDEASSRARAGPCLDPWIPGLDTPPALAKKRQEKAGRAFLVKI
jgi:hypothetical protein